MKTLAIMMGNVIGVSLVMSRCWVVPKDSTVSTPPPIGRRRAEYIKMIFGKEGSIYIENSPPLISMDCRSFGPPVALR